MKKKMQFLTVLMAFSLSVFAQKAFVLKVTGEVSQPLALSLKDIAAMPHQTVSLRGRDQQLHPYSGVLIQTLLAKAGATVGKALHGENLSKYLIAKCADGYTVLYSLAELDSSFTDKRVIIADASEGKPLPEAKGPLRLIVQGEKKPARSCFQVIELIVGDAKDE